MPNTLYIALFQYTGGEFAPMLLRCCCLTVTVGMDGLISYPEIWSLKARLEELRRVRVCVNFPHAWPSFADFCVFPLFRSIEMHFFI